MNIGLPNFVYFNFDPSLPAPSQLQLLVYKPFSIVEKTKQIALATIQHPVSWVGIALGGICSVMVTPIAIAVTLLFLATIGITLALKKVNTARGITGQMVGKFGSNIPFMYSKKTPIKAKLDLSTIPYTPSKYSHLIQKVIEQLANNISTQPPLFCSLTSKPLILPIKAVHTHSNYLIDISAIPFLPPEDTVDITKFELDVAAGKNVIQTANRAFVAVEEILKKIPSSSLIAIDDRDFCPKILQKVSEGEKIFENEQELFTKLIEPDQLTPEEAYAIAYHVSQVLRPTIQIIRRTATVAVTVLNELKDRDKISEELRDEKTNEIRNWAKNLESQMIPEECKIIRSIVSLNIRNN